MHSDQVLAITTFSFVVGIFCLSLRCWCWYRVQVLGCVVLSDEEWALRNKRKKGGRGIVFVFVFVAGLSCSSFMNF